MTPYKHKDCANFINGVCRLYNINVPPEGPACPNFIPRRNLPQRQSSAPLIGYTPQPLPPNVPPVLPFSGFRRRRRYRWRRGWQR
ncbi:MAG: hypothetical protein J7J99_07725 [Thermoprotei archaeon]|nr:hypothetical protein [Thermoprotei archaeon]